MSILEPSSTFVATKVTPHISWLAEGNVERLAQNVAANLENFVRGKQLIDVFDRNLGY
jgi:phosphoglycerate dehydrogenase-like enzyme